MLHTNTAHGVTVALTRYSGSPTLYHSNSTARLPSPDGHDGEPCTPDTPLRIPPAPDVSADAARPATYVFAVGGGDASANFSLIAHSTAAAAALVDGVPTAGTIAGGATSLYRIDVPSGVPSPTLYLTALQGTLRVLTSIDGAEPTERYTLPPPTSHLQPNFHPSPC